MNTAQDVTGYKSGQFFFQILISVKSRGLRLIISDEPQGEEKKVHTGNEA